MKKHHLGSYKCSASNSEGIGESRSINLTVLFCKSSFFSRNRNTCISIIVTMSLFSHFFAFLSLFLVVSSQRFVQSSPGDGKSFDGNRRSQRILILFQFIWKILWIQLLSHAASTLNRYDYHNRHVEMYGKREREKCVTAFDRHAGNKSLGKDQIRRWRRIMWRMMMISVNMLHIQSMGFSQRQSPKCQSVRNRGRDRKRGSQTECLPPSSG